MDVRLSGGRCGRRLWAAGRGLPDGGTPRRWSARSGWFIAVCVCGLARRCRTHVAGWI